MTLKCESEWHCIKQQILGTRQAMSGELGMLPQTTCGPPKVFAGNTRAFARLQTAPLETRNHGGLASKGVGGREGFVLDPR